MTRNFDKQRRYDERPRPYRSSTNKFGAERASSSRPPRARPNRDSVDRAWEQGARQNHADYRQRSAPQSQSPRDRRSYQQGESSAARAQYNRRPSFGNRQDGYRTDERGPRPYDRRQQEPSRYNEQGMRRPYDTRGQEGYRSNERDSRRPYDTRGQEGYRSNERDSRRPYDRRENAPRPYGRPGADDRGYERSSHERQGRYPGEENDRPRRYEQGSHGRYDHNRQGATRYGQRDERPGQPNERGGYARPYKVERIQHQGRDGYRPGSVNPRQQSRPGQFHKNPRYTSEPAQYEGDYERFDSDHTTSTRAQPAPTRQFNDNAPRGKARPKDTQFWSEVNEERDELLDHLESEAQDAEAETGASEASGDEGVTPKVARKNRARRPASAIVRSRKSSAR